MTDPHFEASAGIEQLPAIQELPNPGMMSRALRKIGVIAGATGLLIPGMTAADLAQDDTPAAYAEDTDAISRGEVRCFDTGLTSGRVGIFNITPVRADDFGNGQIIPSDVKNKPPLASDANFRVGSIDPNNAISPIGTDGQVCFANSEHASTDLVVDMKGSLPADIFEPAQTDGSAKRLVDTREGKNTVLPEPVSTDGDNWLGPDDLKGYKCLLIPNGTSWIRRDIYTFNSDKFIPDSNPDGGSYIDSSVVTIVYDFNNFNDNKYTSSVPGEDLSVTVDRIFSNLSDAKDNLKYFSIVHDYPVPPYGFGDYDGSISNYAITNLTCP